jgi:hypothetical protein
MVGRRPLAIALALAGLAIAGQARAECSRAMLQQVAATYVAAQAAGDPARLPLAAGAFYAQNNIGRDIAAGVLSEAMPADFTRSFFDTTQCATFTELTAASAAHPYVIHTRMEVTASGQVARIESVVTDADDWVFGADSHLAQTRVEDWGEIAAGRRDSRAAIRAAADAYLDNWADPDLPVPHGTPCARLEGRVYTGARDPQGQTCDMGAFPQPIHVTHRRYVIDETVGAVSVFHDFPWLDAGLPADRATPASQTFRVEGGMNRYIHEVTACTTPGCSRARPGGG